VSTAQGVHARVVGEVTFLAALVVGHVFADPAKLDALPAVVLGMYASAMPLSSMKVFTVSSSLGRKRSTTTLDWLESMVWNYVQLALEFLESYDELRLRVALQSGKWQNVPAINSEG
jgi:hypothetical protein